MSTRYSNSRRDFLSKMTSTVGSGAALALTSGLSHAAQPEQTDKEVTEKPVSKGYQRTEHVDTYYRLADF